MFTGVRNVLLDIDDTLWENNIFFLAALEWLCREGRGHGLADRATTNLLNRMENHNIVAKGYGYDSYEASLVAAARAMASHSGRTAELPGLTARALRWTRFLRRHPIQWLPGVLESLPDLTTRFRTIIVTKGHPGDQMAKVHRSGLGHLFAGAEVVPHKYPGCYHGVLRKYALQPGETVMVGNSPRSDINMAKRAGLRTIYVPHPKTWYREMEPILEDGPPTLQANHFGEVPGLLRP